MLSGQRVDLKDAIYSAAKEKERAKEQAANPLVLNGQKLIPSVTRVFSKSRDLYVYMQAYEQNLKSRLSSRRQLRNPPAHLAGRARRPPHCPPGLAPQQPYQLL